MQGLKGRATPARPDLEFTALELVRGALQAWQQLCGAELRQAEPAEDPADRNEVRGQHCRKGQRYDRPRRGRGH